MDSLQDLINSSPNPEVRDNHFKLNQMQKLTYEFVGGYIEALPEYAPGSSGKKAIDIFREKNGRDPTYNIIKTSKFTPAFGISGNY